MCAFLRKNKANAFSTQPYRGSSTVWPLGSEVLPGPCPQVTKFSRLIPAGPSLPGGWGRPHLEEWNQFPLQKSSCSCSLISITICHDPSLQRADRSCKLENLSLEFQFSGYLGVEGTQASRCFPGYYPMVLQLISIIDLKAQWWKSLFSAKKSPEILTKIYMSNSFGESRQKYRFYMLWDNWVDVLQLLSLGT